MILGYFFCGVFAAFTGKTCCTYNMHIIVWEIFIFIYNFTKNKSFVKTAWAWYENLRCQCDAKKDQHDGEN